MTVSVTTTNFVSFSILFPSFTTGFYFFTILIFFYFSVRLFQNNRLLVNDVNEITTDRRRTYLVRSPSGLFWVVLSRLTLNRIRTSVFMVEERQPGVAPSPDPPPMAYRITRAATDGRSRTLVRTQFINWSSVLLRNGGVVGSHLFDTNSLSIRLQQAKQVHVEWFSVNRRKRRFTAVTESAATTTSNLQQQPTSD